jgi:cob(I)alamin adenosyltransferase
MTTRRLPFESAVATGHGDDGTTGLLYGGDRIRKDDLRTEAYGTIDEAVAALGVARAELVATPRHGPLSPDFGGLGDLILRLQRELFVAGAELATNPDARNRQRDGETRVSAEMVEGLEVVLRNMEAAIELPREFVVPGETRVSASLELARTIVRRAERRTVTLSAHDTTLAAGRLVPYLNRLADLLWILARRAEQAEARTATAARPARGRGTRSRTASPDRSE